MLSLCTVLCDYSVWVTETESRVRVKRFSQSEFSSTAAAVARTTFLLDRFRNHSHSDWNQLPLSIKKAGSVSASKAQLATYFTKLGLHLTPSLILTPLQIMSLSKKILSFPPSFSPPSLFLFFSLTLSVFLSLSRANPPPLGRIFKLLNVANKGRRRRKYRLRDVSK